MAREISVQKLKEFIENEEICRKIEESIYQYTIEKAKERCIMQDLGDSFFRRIYVNKLHQIYTNINPDSYVKNKYLLDKIMAEELDASKLAFLTPQELNFEHWKPYIEKQTAADEFKGTAASGTRTTEFMCGRCKGRNTSYVIAQLRSADEPSSYLIVCLDCGKKWRMN